MGVGLGFGDLNNVIVVMKDGGCTELNDVDNDHLLDK